MKILEMIIKNKSGDIVRDIKFKETGLTFIYGDIKEPQNINATINSLGKTLFLKMIDYIFGANNDPKTMKKDIDGFELHAKIKFKEKCYLVKRVIGASKEEAIFVNAESKTITEYRTMFEINRSYLDKQIILNRKNSEVSLRENPNKSDYTALLELLDLNSLCSEVQKIYDFQDELKKLTKESKAFTEEFDDILKENETLTEKIFVIDKTVEELQKNLDGISKQVSDLETSAIKEDSIKEYELKNIEFKKLSQNLEQLKIEQKRLVNYINEVDSNEITNAQLIKMFNKAEVELPQMVIKKLEEVEEFHKNVVSERKQTIKKNIERTSLLIEKTSRELEVLSNELDRLGKILSENKAYRESIELYGEYNLRLQELLFQQGQLTNVKKINDEITELDKNLTTSFSKSKLELENEVVKNKIKSYREFVFNLVKEIYSKSIISFFDIEIKDRHKTRRPIELKLSMQGETGEGISEVKKNIVDYLVFNFNKELEILIQDSSCYNGIDPRQVSNMLVELNKMAINNQKQAIVAINKYQLVSDNQHDVFKIFDEKFGIKLSEDNKLLRFNF
ncbi:DUF2326 domain-containing protein [Vagococcus silagei]|nr:DUF2326 domain-containing protein [Vagococcus silagei]